MAGSYDYNSLINRYLLQSAPNSSTAKGRMSFDGTKLYSYNSLLAKLDLSTNILYIDRYISRYSNTTAKHTYRLIAAANTFNIRHYRIDLSATPDNVLNDYIDDIYIYLDKLSRARTKGHIHKDMIKTTVASIQTYMEYHTIDKRRKPYKRWIKLIQHLFQQKLL